MFFMKDAFELRRIKRSLYGTQSVCEMAWSGAISSTVEARRIAFDPAVAIAALLPAGNCWCLIL